jgi:hypothetical protein
MTYTANRQKLTGQDMTQAYINKDKPATPAVAAAAVAPVNNTRQRRPVGRPSAGSPQPLSIHTGSASTSKTQKKKNATLHAKKKFLSHLVLI